MIAAQVYMCDLYCQVYTVYCGDFGNLELLVQGLISVYFRVKELFDPVIVLAKEREFKDRII